MRGMHGGLRVQGARRDTHARTAGLTLQAWLCHQGACGRVCGFTSLRRLHTSMALICMQTATSR